MLQEHVLATEKHELYFSLFQKRANAAYEAGVYGFYCTKTAPAIHPFGLLDPYKAKTGFHMEKLVNLYVFETKAQFDKAKKYYDSAEGVDLRCRPW